MRKTLLMLVMMFTAMAASAQSVKTLGTVDNAVMQCDKKQGCCKQGEKKQNCEVKCKKAEQNCAVKCKKAEQNCEVKCKKAEQNCEVKCKKAEQNCKVKCKKAEQKQGCGGCK